MYAALVQLDQKLLWIPVFFVVFRIWGTIRWLIASTDPNCWTIDLQCSAEKHNIWYNTECLNVLYAPFLVYMQAIGDPGQGWGNALLYVLFHVAILKRLCHCFYYCWRRAKSYLQNRQGHTGISNLQEAKFSAWNISSQIYTPTTEDLTVSDRGGHKSVPQDVNSVKCKI